MNGFEMLFCGILLGVALAVMGDNIEPYLKKIKVWLKVNKWLK